jgi:hypothetical protein
VIVGVQAVINFRENDIEWLAGLGLHRRETEGFSDMEDIDKWTIIENAKLLFIFVAHQVPEESW